jgi:cytochrome b pre-mRNA-processing protein 3
MIPLFKRKPYGPESRALYQACVTAARMPCFYTDLGVPDTLDGRFEMISLHMFIIMFRLKNDTTPACDALAQALFDAMFKDMDNSLREMGVGDLSVPKKVKQMMIALNGRCTAYTQAVKQGTMRDAVTRNIYGTVDAPSDTALTMMTDYITSQLKIILAAPIDTLMTGTYTFSPGPGTPHS